MSSINSIGGSGYSMMMSGMKRPDPAQMADNLFSRLDTKNKGYLEKSDLQSASGQRPDSGSGPANVDEMFKKLDSDGDGKLTKSEMTSGMKNLADALDSQLNQMRMNGMSQGGNGDSTTTSGINRPDPAKMVDNLFSKLDTTNKGYLEKSDLQSALSQPSGSDSGPANIDEIFKRLDSNGDGKLTKSEMTSGTAQAGNVGGTPPTGGMPPPGAAGANAASVTSSTDASSSTKAYEPADANQDGKVSEQERMAFALAKQDKESPSRTSPTLPGSDARVMKQIMDLMHAYTSFNSSSNSSGLSVTA